MFCLLAVIAAITVLGTDAASDCTATINSLDDVSAAKECTTVNINGFTVPAGEGFTLSLAQGTTVNLSKYLLLSTHALWREFTSLNVDGDILFGNKSWSGPLFTISG